MQEEPHLREDPGMTLAAPEVPTPMEDGMYSYIVSDCMYICRQVCMQEEPQPREDHGMTLAHPEVPTPMEDGMYSCMCHGIECIMHK